MTRRARIWSLVAFLFTLVNVLGAPLALAEHELPHAALHVVLALLGAFVWWRIALGSRATRLADPDGAELPASNELTSRLSQLEQSVEAVAIEVERIGEGQRYVTRMMSEQEPQVKREGGPSAPPRTSSS